MSEHEPERDENADDEDDFEGQGINIGRADDTSDEPAPRREEQTDQP